MKYRPGKIKCQHSMIEGLRDFLEEIEVWDEITGIIPGEIKSIQGSGTRAFKVKVQYKTTAGVKCKAIGKGAQEVFIISPVPDELIKKLESLIGV